VRVVRLATVRHVERPQPDAATGRPEGARLDVAVELGHAVEADGHVLEPDPADDRDAVPLVVADASHVVAQHLQTHDRDLLLARLGLLQRQYVDVMALQEGLDPVDA